MSEAEAQEIDEHEMQKIVDLFTNKLAVDEDVGSLLHKMDFLILKTLHMFPLMNLS